MNDSAHETGDAEAVAQALVDAFLRYNSNFRELTRRAASCFEHCDWEKGRDNAIARIDGRDGMMKNDIVSNPGPGTLTFITPDLRFRMEYYFPYTAKDKERSFDYFWLADISAQLSPGAARDRNRSRCVSRRTA